jgi:ribosomal protein S6
MEEHDTKEYEISFLFTDEGAFSDVLAAVKNHGAEVTFEGPPKRVALAYPIKKEAHAFFGYCHARLLPERLGALKKELELHPAVARVLMTTPPLKKAERFAPSPEREAGALASREPPTPKRREALPLSNEELEKKIGEILQ